MRTTKKISLFCCTLLVITSLLVVVMLAVIYDSWDRFNIDTYTCMSGTCLRVASSVLSRMNASTDPCSDFYEFACGGYARNPVPWTSAMGARVYADLVNAVQTDLYSLLPLSSRQRNASNATWVQPGFTTVTDHLATFVRNCESTLARESTSRTAQKFVEKVVNFKMKRLLEKDPLASASILTKLARVGLPFLLNFQVRSNYKDIPCLSERVEDGDKSTNFLCVDVVPPVLRLYHADARISKDKFMNFLRSFYAVILGESFTASAYLGMIKLNRFHAKLSSVYRKHAIVTHNVSDLVNTYYPVNLSRQETLPRFRDSLVALARRTGTPEDKIYIRNQRLLEDLDSVIHTVKTHVVVNYAVLDAFIRMKLMLGTDSTLVDKSPASYLYILDPQVLSIFSLTAVSSQTGVLSVPKRCLELAYTTHRSHFKAIHRKRFGEASAAQREIFAQVKTVFMEKLREASWMSNKTQHTLSYIIDEMPFETTPVFNVSVPLPYIDVDDEYGPDFSENLIAALTKSVKVDGRAWTALGTLGEHLHTFSRFRQFFRDGLMWRHLVDEEFYPDYIGYGRVGYLSAYEMADVLETHPLSVYSTFSRLFTLLETPKIIYIVRRNSLLKLYRSLVPPGGKDGTSESVYRPRGYLQDVVANSIAITFAYEAFARSQGETVDANRTSAPPGFLSNSDRSWRLPNLNSYSDAKKFFIVMTQMWCERLTERQYRRTYLKASTIVGSNDGVTGISGWAGAGLSQTQPGNLTTAAMMRATAIFSTTFSCSLVGPYEDVGIFTSV